MFPGPKSLLFSRRILAPASFVFVCLQLPIAHAQSEISDVHIEPRVQSRVGGSLANLYLSTIRTQAELVLVPVSVTDTTNRVVVGLEQGNFQLYEGKPSRRSNISPARMRRSHWV